MAQFFAVRSCAKPFLFLLTLEIVSILGGFASEDLGFSSHGVFLPVDLQRGSDMNFKFERMGILIRWKFNLSGLIINFGKHFVSDSAVSGMSRLDTEQECFGFIRTGWSIERFDIVMNVGWRRWGAIRWAVKYLFWLNGAFRQWPHSPRGGIGGVHWGTGTVA